MNTTTPGVVTFSLDTVTVTFGGKEEAIRFVSELSARGMTIHLTPQQHQGHLFAHRDLTALKQYLNQLNVEERYSILHHCIHVGYDWLGGLTAVLNTGLDVNWVDPDTGNTALHLADTPKVVGFLLNKGARVDVVNNQGQSPLCYKSRPATKLLLSAGADPNGQPGTDRPLRRVLIIMSSYLSNPAELRGFVSTIRVLVNAGATVYSEDTALYNSTLAPSDQYPSLAEANQVLRRLEVLLRKHL